MFNVLEFGLDTTTVDLNQAAAEQNSLNCLGIQPVLSIVSMSKGHKAKEAAQNELSSFTAHLTAPSGSGVKSFRLSPCRDDHISLSVTLSDSFHFC